MTTASMRARLTTSRGEMTMAAHHNHANRDLCAKREGGRRASCFFIVTIMLRTPRVVPCNAR
jgi:hypothetical protein